jgi:hypothetical protein
LSVATVESLVDSCPCPSLHALDADSAPSTSAATVSLRTPTSAADDSLSAVWQLLVSEMFPSDETASAATVPSRRSTVAALNELCEPLFVVSES